jgi:DNA (cytosine-5)-methyltransferase 1
VGRREPHTGAKSIPSPPQLSMDGNQQLELLANTPSGPDDGMRAIEASLAVAASRVVRAQARARLSVVGLFAGIGGIEVGFQRAGHESALLCEIDPHARAVLEARFPDVPLISDVRDLPALPRADVIAAGFPCQDLSQAGRTAGIAGRQSGLVSEVFRLIDDPARAPKWLVLENVPFMLQLHRGEAMRFLTEALVELGYAWAYRVVDTRAFGLPQRRRRVILVASRTEDPCAVVFADDVTAAIEVEELATAFGFYWTEGTRGLGWGIDVVPTLKGGSTIGIPSPPAVWFPDEGFVGTPDIRDAERLQGFDTDWTAPAAIGARGAGARWKLVGNAVSVPVAEWLGRRLTDPGEDRSLKQSLASCTRWPAAAYGDASGVLKVDISPWPAAAPSHGLRAFLKHPLKPLSVRATSGFLRRARDGRLRFMPGFLEDVERHLRNLDGTGNAWTLERVGDALNH